MESTCHKRVIIRCVTEYHKLGTAKGILLFGRLCGCKDDLAHQFYGIHIDTGLGGANIYRTADTLCLCHCLRNGADKKLLCRSHSLAYQCGISANKVNANFLGTFIQCSCDGHKIFRFLTCSSANQSDRCYRNSFIYNRDPVLGCDLITGRYQVSGFCGDLLIYFLIQCIQVRIDTVQKADTHGDGTHIQILLLDHFICLVYLKNIDHFIFSLMIDVK